MLWLNEDGMPRQAHGRHHTFDAGNRRVAALGLPDFSCTPHMCRHSFSPQGRVARCRFLADNDIVVNCVLQDPAAPLIFVTEKDLGALAAGSLIVDVSCDVGMGFSWAQPTSFTQPLVEVANGVHYYAVDHSPSHLWNSAIWEIGEALLPHIEAALAGPAAWNATPTISRAIEIRDGVAFNPSILSFQHREAAYPHVVRIDSTEQS